MTQEYREAVQELTDVCHDIITAYLNHDEEAASRLLPRLMDRLYEVENRDFCLGSEEQKYLTQRNR